MSDSASQNLRDQFQPAPEIGKGLVVKIGMPLAVVGAGMCVASFMQDKTTFAFSYLLGFMFAWTIVLGSLLFVALQLVTNAVWSVVLRRIAEIFASMMPVLAILFIPIVVLAGPAHLFSWMNAEHMAADPVLSGKQAYLNFPFWAARAGIFFLIWIGFSVFYIRTSLGQDKGKGGVEATQKMRARSTIFLPLFALSLTFASFDWLMSLEPHFFSTIFGVYMFGACVLSSLAAITLGLLWSEKQGLIGKNILRKDHLYSLGSLMFAFTVFWTYIAISQMLLIWYANMPEETFWFVDRWKGGWMPISLLLILLRFVIPFFALMSIYAKKSRFMLCFMSVVILIGQFVDLFWLIIPEMPEGLGYPWWQCIGATLFTSGVLIIGFGRFISKHPAVAAGDPLLEKSCDFHL